MKTIDHGFGKLVEETHRLAGLDIAVGVLEKDAEETYPNGMTIIEVAAIQEYGTATIPARPFMSDTAIEYEKKAADVMQEQLEKVIAGSISATEAADEVGLWFRGRINAHINNGSWEENAPSTIRRKGHDKPLIDTKQLYNSIDHEVRKR